MKSLTFSSMQQAQLEKLNISLGGLLQLKVGYEQRADEIEIVGTTEHWSSEGLYRHLRVLRELIPSPVSGYGGW
jgi:hypothetical protein